MTVLVIQVVFFMSEKIWKDVENFKGLYTVKKVKSGETVKPNLKYNKSSCYYTVRIHRVVAYVFVPGRSEYKNVVNHLDETS